MKRFWIALLLFWPCLSMAQSPPELQLPPIAEPLHYRISLTVLPDHESFTGETHIRIRLLRQSDFLWLHGNGLQIAESNATFSNGESISTIYEQVTESGVVRISFGRMLEPQELELHFRYTAPFNEQLEGLYRVKEAGQWYAFSQFQSTSARLCFPAFDEPRFKTPFDLSMIIRNQETAVSSSRTTAEEELGNGLKRVSFATTPKLPTYLIAFAAGPFDVVSAPMIAPNNVRSTPLTLRGIAVHGKGPLLSHSLWATTALLKNIESYFGTPYPFDKLDIIAVPDFEADAMENVGAIAVRDTYLLIDEDESPLENQRYVGLVLAHELTHMWFGNLVTMQWWDDIWLSESFATWMEDKIVSEWNPSYRADVYAMENTIYAMDEDSLAAARRVRQPIETTDDIYNIFDPITYYKGAAVLSMFEAYLGPDVFRKGIQLYLDRHRWGSATADDFLKALDDASDQNTGAAMQTFLTETGVPYLEVHPSCHDGRRKVHLLQTRYLPLGSRGSPERRWTLPVCLKYSEREQSAERCVLLDRKEQSIDLPGDCSGWILPNAGAAGYFRWVLPPDDYSRLNTAPLSTREKLSVADSLRAAFRNGRIPASTAFQQMEAFALSGDRTLASASMDLFRFSIRYLSPDFRKYAGTTFRKALDTLPDDDENEESHLLRKDLLTVLAFLVRDPETRSELSRKGFASIQNEMVNPDAVDSDFRDTALGVAVQVGGERFFNRLLDIYRKTDDAALREQILIALGRSTDPGLAERLRDFVFHQDVRLNEIPIVLYAQSRQIENIDGLWRWLQANFDRLLERWPPEGSGDILFFADSFCDEQKAQEVETFFRPRVDELAGGRRNLEAVIESIRLCAATTKAQRDSALKFLEGLNR